MKLMKKVAALTLTAAMAMSCAGATTVSADSLENYGADYLESVKEKGELVVGCDPTIEGVCYLDSVSGDVTGFIPEIINGYAEEIGCTVKWEVLEWSAMLTAVNSGR